MRALLLCAGLGTRLRPITNHIPKVLVPINAKPLLTYWLENLSNIGIEKFLINSSYLHNQIKAYVDNSPYKDKIKLSYEKKLLNTGGSLLSNRDFFQEEDCMLIHADNLSFCDYKAFIKAHYNRPKACEITMMLFKSDRPSSCGIVELNERGVVIDFFEKVENPPSNLANGAVYICTPAVIDFMESLKKEEIDFSLEVLPHFIGRIYTFLNDTYHRDIGTVESYALAQVEIYGTLLAR
jgi:mannose-1-phosphate guanylyltransferase